jgi:hypothetical protein
MEDTVRENSARGDLGNTADEPAGADVPIIVGWGNTEAIVNEADFDSAAFGQTPAEARTADESCRATRPNTPVTSEDYIDRRLLSGLADDGSPHCGEVDELDWPV